MIKWLQPHCFTPPAPVAESEIFWSELLQALVQPEPLSTYTTREGQTWQLHNVRPSGHPGFVDAIRAEDGVPVTVHESKINREH